MHFDCSLQEVHHIWYKALSLAQVGNVFSFPNKKRGKNWAERFRSISKTLCTESKETGCISKFLLQKYTVPKKNHLIWSSKSGDIADLKSAIFQNFSDGRGNCSEKIF